MSRAYLERVRADFASFGPEMLADFDRTTAPADLPLLDLTRVDVPGGAPRTAVEVDASSIGHDLTRGVAHFSRTRRAPGETAAESAEAQAPASRPPSGDGRAAGDPVTGAEEEAAVGDGLLDDRAVAEFASEMSDTLGEVPALPDEPATADHTPADDAPVPF